jgi:hypothetical protein
MVMDNNKDVRLITLIARYDAHTDQFSKILTEASEKDLSRDDLYSKSVPWIVGNQVQLRFEVANLLGIEMQQSADKIFRANVNINFNINYPSLDNFREDWEKISPVLRNEILQLDNVDLFTFSKHEPIMKGTFFDLFSYVISREREIIYGLTVWRGLLI